ncbi:MAG: chemotaxis protein CheX [Deltaproteobacteria bacterium]|nr:chemotaxis protein CheX [Deltaproteobacteria bacterium]
MLAIHCPEAVGLTRAGSMLGIELDEINADVKDALGEIANMVAGGVNEKFGQEKIKIRIGNSNCDHGEVLHCFFAETQSSHCHPLRY